MRTQDQLADQGKNDADDVSVMLEVVRGRARFRLRPVKGPTFLIGAGHHCDLVLGDSHFPDVHACISIRPNVVTIQHLGPGPYVRVDRKVVRDAVLQHGQTIEMGPYVFRVYIAFPNVTAPTTMRRYDGPHTTAMKLPLGAGQRPTTGIVPKPHTLSSFVGSWQSVTVGEEIVVLPAASDD